MRTTFEVRGVARDEYARVSTENYAFMELHEASMEASMKTPDSMEPSWSSVGVSMQCPIM